jgi:hypothetical protein
MGIEAMHQWGMLCTILEPRQERSSQHVDLTQAPCCQHDVMDHSQEQFDCNEKSFPELKTGRAITRRWKFGYDTRLLSIWGGESMTH